MQTHRELVEAKHDFTRSSESYLDWFLAMMRAWIESRPAKIADNSRIEAMVDRLINPTKGEIAEVLMVFEEMERPGGLNLVVLQHLLEEIIDCLFITMGIVYCHNLQLDFNAITREVNGTGKGSNAFDLAEQIAGEIDQHSDPRIVTNFIQHLIAHLFSILANSPAANNIQDATKGIFLKNDENHLAIYNVGFHPGTGKALSNEELVSFAEHVYGCLRILRKYPGFQNSPLFHLLFVQYILDFENSEVAQKQMSDKLSMMSTQEMMAALQAIQNGGQILLPAEFKAWQDWYNTRATLEMKTAADSLVVMRRRGIVIH
ncbi:MAG: hypothetical protein ACOZAN_01275 [Patescibacteria group bacterium]